MLLITSLRGPDGTYTSGRLDSRPSGAWHPGQKVKQGVAAAGLCALRQVPQASPARLLTTCCGARPACSASLQLADGSKIRSLRVTASIQAPPPGQGIAGACWMSPVNLTYGAWPASGEVRRKGRRGTAWRGDGWAPACPRQPEMSFHPETLSHAPISSSCTAHATADRRLWRHQREGRGDAGPALWRAM